MSPVVKAQSQRLPALGQLDQRDVDVIADAISPKSIPSSFGSLHSLRSLIWTAYRHCPVSVKAAQK